MMNWILRSAIQQIERTRANGGARITGWIKPSIHHTENDNASVEVKRIHVVSDEPIKAATDDMKNHKYATVFTAAVTAAAEIVDGQTTTRPRDTISPPQVAHVRSPCNCYT